MAGTSEPETKEQARKRERESKCMRHAMALSLLCKVNAVANIERVENLFHSNPY